MNEEAVILWIRRAESDLKIGRDELVTEDPSGSSQRRSFRPVKAIPVFSPTMC
jgi:hypothetical protein